MNSDCIFCTLYNRKTNIIYETNRIFILVDRYPLASKHLLIIPKIHHSYFHQYSSENLSDVLETTKYLVERFSFKEYNLLQNNGNHQSIFHIHFHIIPFVSEYECLVIDWKTILPSDEDYAKKVKKAKAKVSNN